MILLTVDRSNGVDDVPSRQKESWCYANFTGFASSNVMHHGRGEGGPGAAKNLLRNPILLGQCLIGGIGDGVDGQQRNVTFPDYDPLVDLVIPREGACVVAWPFGTTLDVAVVVGCSRTGGTATVLVAAPRRQLLYGDVLFFFNSTLTRFRILRKSAVVQAPRTKL